MFELLPTKKRGRDENGIMQQSSIFISVVRVVDDFKGDCIEDEQDRILQKLLLHGWRNDLVRGETNNSV